MSGSQAGGAPTPDRVIPGYGAYSIPTLESIGGEMAVLAVTGDPDGIDLFTAAAATCVAWAQVADRDSVKTWLRAAISNLSDEELLAFNDIALASPDALPDLAAVLADAWSAVSEADGALRGSVAIEGWTRLALVVGRRQYRCVVRYWTYAALDNGGDVNQCLPSAFTRSSLGSWADARS